MNVHRVTSNLSEDVEQVKNDILNTTNHSNDDMHIKLKGYMHSNSGFILTAENMEKINDEIFGTWKALISKRGYKCEFQYDFQQGWVDIKCLQVKRKTCMKVSYLYSLGYLSLIIFGIYTIWYRHNKLLPK